MDKLAEQSAEAQNVAPNVSTAGATLSSGSSAVSRCGFGHKGAQDGTDRSTDSGKHSSSIVSQTVGQVRVLQESKPVYSIAGQQSGKGTPSLPALPPSMLFSAPPQATQVPTMLTDVNFARIFTLRDEYDDYHDLQADSKVMTAPSSSPVLSQSVSHSSSIPRPTRFPQQPQSQHPFTSSSTHEHHEPPAINLLTKLKSRAAASMLGGCVDNQTKPKASAVPSELDQLPHSRNELTEFSVHRSESRTAVQGISPNTGAGGAIYAPLGGAGGAGSGYTPAAAPPALLQPSAQDLVPSVPSKSPHSGPLVRAMLEQSACERAMQFAREESLAVAPMPAAASNSIVASTVKIQRTSADNRVTAGEGKGAAASQSMISTGANPLLSFFRGDFSLVIISDIGGSAGGVHAEVDVGPHMLPQVTLTAADEEALFGLTVRLQYAETELEVITGLQELAFCTVLDIPPTAILQRSSLLDTVLQLACSAAAETARHLAVLFLHSLVVQTKQALLQTVDSEQSPLYDGTCLAELCLRPELLLCCAVALCSPRVASGKFAFKDTDAACSVRWA